MGYRSDVTIALGVEAENSADVMNRLMAVYSIDPLVQKHVKDNWKWEVYQYIANKSGEKGISVAVFEAVGVKWYDTYEDVQAILRLLEIAKSMLDSSGESPAPWAWKSIRIGEEVGDIEDECCLSTNDGSDYDILDVLEDCFWVERSIGSDKERLLK
jgi:hypothetical protein